MPKRVRIFGRVQPISRGQGNLRFYERVVISDMNDLAMVKPVLRSSFPYVVALVLAEIALGGLVALIGVLGTVLLSAAFLAAMWLTRDVRAYLYLLPFFIGAPLRLTSYSNIGIHLLNLLFSMVFVLLFTRLALSDKEFWFNIPKKKVIGLFLLSIGFSIAKAANPSVTLYQLAKMVLVLAFVYVVVYNLCSSERFIRRLFYAVILAGVVSAFNGIVENYFLTGGITRVEGVRVFAGAGGGYGSFIGIALSFALAGFLYQKEKPWIRLLCLLSIPPLIMALMLSQTRAWTLGSTAASLFLVFHWARAELTLGKKTVVFVSLLLLLVLFFGQVRNIGSVLFVRAGNPSRSATLTAAREDMSLLQRFRFWQLGWSSFLRNPVTGMGLGNVRFSGWKQAEVTGSEEGSNLAFTDNHYVGVLAETGIVGACGWVLLLVTIFRSARSSLKNTANRQQRMLVAGTCGGLIAVLIGAFFWNMTTSTIDSSRLFLLIGMLFSLEKVMSRNAG